MLFVLTIVLGGKGDFAPDKNKAVLSGMLTKYVTHGTGKHERFCLLFEDFICW